MSNWDDYDDEDEFESFAQRKDRRKPQGRRKVQDLKIGAEQRPFVSSATKFDDLGLQDLYEEGHLNDILAQLQSGKEATVYLAEGPKGYLAAKVYAERSLRSFKVDEVYTMGRYYNKARRKKAARASRETGLGVEEILWIQQEFLHLEQLFEAGIKVPEPVAQAGAVILMGYLGTEAEPAPRLSDIALSLEEAQHAWRQALDAYVAMLELGKVHSDYSAYNLLWWQDEVWVIDLPQMVDRKENKQWKQLLIRDIDSLTKSFEGFGLSLDRDEVLAEIGTRVGIFGI